MNDGGGGRAKGIVGEGIPRGVVDGTARQPFSSGVTRNAFEREEMAVVLHEVEENLDGVDRPSNHHVEAHLVH